MSWKQTSVNTWEYRGRNITRADGRFIVICTKYGEHNTAGTLTDALALINKNADRY